MDSSVAIVYNMYKLIKKRQMYDIDFHYRKLGAIPYILHNNCMNLMNLKNGSHTIFGYIVFVIGFFLLDTLDIIWLKIVSTVHSVHCD
jgi:hypothetical protein